MGAQQSLAQGSGSLSPVPGDQEGLLAQHTQQRISPWRALGLGQIGLQLAATLALLGCSEPVDCAKEPARCLPAAYGSTGTAVVGAAQVLRPSPVQAQANAVPRGAGPSPTAIANPSADLAKRRLRALPPTDSLVARSREGVVAQVKDDAAAGVVGPELKLRAIRKTLAAAVPALKQHDFSALKKVASQRFAGNIVEIEAKYAERFWRHADKYVPVLSGPPPAIALQDQEDGKVQATLTTPEGAELRCILVEEDGTWKIDRF